MATLQGLLMWICPSQRARSLVSQAGWHCLDFPSISFSGDRFYIWY